MSITNNVAGHIGRAVTVNVLGKDWTFSRWTRRVWVDFVAFAKQELPNPIDVAMNAVADATTKDMEVIRELSKKDAAELAKAAEEKRPPVLMMESYRPIADVLLAKAQELAGCYLDFNGKPINTLLASVTGASYAVYLLLREKHPDVTPDDAYDVMMALPSEAEKKAAPGLVTLKDIFETVRGSVPARGTPLKNEPSQAG